MTYTQRFVRLGYGDMFNLPTRSLDFRTEPVSAAEAVELVKLVKGYNEYNGKRVAAVILYINELWKSDYQQVTFSFGREASAVLYVHCPYWKSNTDQFENRAELIERTKVVLEGAKADEINNT